MAVRSREAGLTLVELVVAIVVIALGVTAVLAMLAQGFRSSPDPQLRIKAVELAQAYMEEMRSVRWDNKPKSRRDCVDSGGSTACSSGPTATCTVSGGCGLDGPESFSDADRDLLDDVDDYDGLQEGTRCGHAHELRDSSGQARSARYGGYCVAIQVGFDDGLANVPAADAKLIQITITDPRGWQSQFALYRLNYG